MSYRIFSFINITFGFSEEEHIFLPLLWDVRNFNVLLKGLVKILELLVESLSFIGLFEVFYAMTNVLCLLGVTEIVEG